MSRLTGLRRLLTPGQAPAPDRRWPALRSALMGQAPAEGVALSALAKAARCAEVPTLAALAHPALGRELQRAVRRQALVDMNLELALERVARALSTAGIERVALLKGTATAHTVYAQPHYRFRRDIDLLVSDLDMGEVLAALRADGWRTDLDEAEIHKGPLGVRAWSMVLELPIGELSCDVHRRLTAGERFTIDTEGILDRRVIGPAPLPVASPEDLLLHTALHIATSGFYEPLRAWLDLVRLLGPRGRIDRDLVARRAHEWGAQAALWSTLIVLERWFGVFEPELTSALRPAPPRAHALRWLLSGQGQYPLRRDAGKAAATLATALLITDTAVGRLSWLRTAAARRWPHAKN